MTTARRIGKPRPGWARRNAALRSLWPGCQLYLPLNEMGSRSVNDLSGNGNWAKAALGFNEATDWLPSPWGPSLDFDGSSATNKSWYTDNVAATNGQSQLTVFCVVRTDAWNSKRWIGKQDSTSSRWVLGERTTTDSLLIYLVAVDSTSSFGVYQASNLTGVWFSTGFVFDGAGADNAARLKAYLNGRPIALSFTGTIPAATPVTTSPLTIGRETPVGAVMDGGVALLIVWNRTLAAREMEILAADPFCMIRPDEDWALWTGAMGGGGAPPAGTVGAMLKTTELGNSLFRGLIHAN